MLGKRGGGGSGGGGSPKLIAIKCIEGIDHSTNDFTTMPNVPGEYGSALERSTFQVVIYQTTPTQTQ